MKKRLRDARTLTQDMLAEGAKCSKCGDTDNLTLDHVVPTQILMWFGITKEESVDRFYVQLYCKRCNQYKGNSLDTSNPRTKEILLKLLDEVHVTKS